MVKENKHGKRYYGKSCKRNFRGNRYSKVDNEDTTHEHPDPSSPNLEDETLPPLQVAGEQNSSEEIPFTIKGRRIVTYGSFISQLQEANIHPGPFSCNLNNMKVVHERINGLKSEVTLVCSLCSYSVIIFGDPDDRKMDINTASVSGALAIGIGHSQVNEFFGVLDIPVMSELSFRKTEQKIGDALSSTALDLMKRAAEKEAQLARDSGDIDANGIPLVAVVADGTWAKRSYRTKYNSLSGAAAIIGCRTKQVLHLGVKNKYCTMCAMAEKQNQTPREHSCYRNWTGSSTSMETAIIVEGFQTSLEMYGIKYNRLVGDGDSSVYHALVNKRPYADLAIEKIECTNHLLRNFAKKLKTLAENKHAGPIKYRKMLNGKVLTLRGAVKAAAMYWHLSNEAFQTRVDNLNQDILNSPSHVFGDHNKCASYFCNGSKEDEINLVPELKKSGLWEKILEITTFLAVHSKSLVQKLTSNIVENFNSLVAKFVGGKRVNFTARGSYTHRCMEAVLTQNSETPFSSLHHKMYQSSPGYFTKIMEKKRLARLRRSRMRETRAKKKLFINSKPDQDYGPSANRPDMDLDIFKKSCDLYLDKLKVNSCDELEKDTTQQSLSLKWQEERRKRLTASNFGVVCKRKSTTSCKNLVKTLLYKPPLKNKYILHGKIYENKAIQLLADSLQLQINQCGLFVDEKLPYLGASPDGLIGNDCTVEVKCPYSLKDVTPEEAMFSKKFGLWRNSSAGGRVINKRHNYYYQVVKHYTYYARVVWKISSVILQRPNGVR